MVTSPTDVKPGSRVLRLDNTIIEYEKGGEGARFFEARRSRVATTAQIFGSYRGEGP